jgi:IclR family transcriptional regulator, pca regulon regulatory protein
MDTQSKKIKENYFTNTLSRGLQVLSAFTPQKPSLSISEITELTGLPQSTTFRLVYTLENLGYLIRDQETRKYRHSSRMLAIGLATLESLDIREVALPYMQALSHSIDETVKLGILDGVEVVILASVVAPDKLSMPTPIGHRWPVYCSSLGKVLLAYQPPDKRDKSIAAIEFKPRTARTIIDPVEFKDHLRLTQERGYSTVEEELIAGMGSIAAPIFDHNGDVIAAIDISTLRFGPDIHNNQHRLVQELINCAKQISKSLGYNKEGQLISKI